MKIKDLKTFIGDAPDNYELALSGEFEPDAALWIVLLNEKQQLLKTLSLTEQPNRFIAESQLQELDTNPNSQETDENIED